MNTRITLYLDPQTSEASAEFDTLADALASGSSVDAGAQLMARGQVLATVLERATGWTLTTWGADRLAVEALRLAA